MFDAENDLDDLLTMQAAEIETKYRQENSASESNDYEYALKLSQKLNHQSNSKNSAAASEDQSSNNYLATLVDEFNSNFDDVNTKHIDSDYLLALKLSQTGDCPIRTSHNLDSDLSLALKLSHKDVAPSCHSNDYDLETIVDEFNSDFDNINTTNIDSDYLLALKLTKAGDTQARNIREIDDDYMLAVRLSEPDSGPIKFARKKLLDNSQNVNMYLDKTISVVDPSWETIDPNPDIYALFISFNRRFFWGQLDMVEVKWSTRMTLCAGICSYQQRAGHCTVKLSKPLLKFRPRKDLVETLLHEMIHAYLFVTKNNRDRDGHGPQFHSHMYRINKESGANITVYHSFHDEVKIYQTHWWKCDGPCQFRSPFFGFVKRSRNRAPGPYDTWWTDHRATCGGAFQKIKEPQNYEKKKSSANNKTETKVTDKVETASIKDYFNHPISKSSAESSSFATKEAKTKTSSMTSPNVKISTPVIQKKKIFTLSDLSKNINKRSPTKSPKKWVPLPGQQNILHFVNKS